MLYGHSIALYMYLYNFKRANKCIAHWTIHSYNWYVYVWKIVEILNESMQNNIYDGYTYNIHTSSERNFNLKK